MQSCEGDMACSKTKGQKVSPSSNNTITITITIVLHVDNSVLVCCRHMIRLHNTLQECMLMPSETQSLSSTFQILLQNRTGTVNEITIKM